MKRTLETLSTMSDDELNKLATELTGKCWHEHNEKGLSICRKCGEYFSALDETDYCNAIADAWELVEFAESKGFSAQIFTYNKSVSFHSTNDSGMWFIADVEYVQADTMPKAITLAFCLAVELADTPSNRQ